MVNARCRTTEHCCWYLSTQVKSDNYVWVPDMRRGSLFQAVETCTLALVQHLEIEVRGQRLSICSTQLHTVCFILRAVCKH